MLFLSFVFVLKNAGLVIRVAGDKARKVGNSHLFPVFFIIKNTEDKVYHF